MCVAAYSEVLFCVDFANEREFLIEFRNYHEAAASQGSLPCLGQKGSGCNRYEEASLRRDRERSQGNDDARLGVFTDADHVAVSDAADRSTGLPPRPRGQGRVRSTFCEPSSSNSASKMACSFGVVARCLVPLWHPYICSVFSLSGTFQLTPTSTHPQLTVIVSYSDQRAPQLASTTPLSTHDEFGDLITEAGAGPQASFLDDLKAAKVDSGCKAKVVFQPTHRR